MKHVSFQHTIYTDVHMSAWLVYSKFGQHITDFCNYSLSDLDILVFYAMRCAACTPRPKRSHLIIKYE